MICDALGTHASGYYFDHQFKQLLPSLSLAIGLSIGEGIDLCRIKDLPSKDWISFVCTGAIVKGNAFTQVNPTNVTLTLTNNATLTWLWSTNYWLAISTSGSGSVTGSTNGWYLAGSSVTVTSAPNPGYTFAGWTGDVPPGSTNNAIQTMTMSQARTVMAHFVVSAGPTQTLTIVSEHGTGLPLAGIYTNANGSTLTNLITGVQTMIGGTTQYVNTGWTLAGSSQLGNAGG